MHDNAHPLLIHIRTVGGRELLRCIVRFLSSILRTLTINDSLLNWEGKKLDDER